MHVGVGGADQQRALVGVGRVEPGELDAVAELRSGREGRKSEGPAGILLGGHDRRVPCVGDGRGPQAAADGGWRMAGGGSVADLTPSAASLGAPVAYGA